MTRPDPKRNDGHRLRGGDHAHNWRDKRASDYFDYDDALARLRVTLAEIYGDEEI